MTSRAENAPNPEGSREEHLLEQVSWIGRLARQLVADPDLAADLAQETCVVALQESPRDVRSLRRWLASVMRNLLRQHARGEGRRRVRETATAQGEADDTAARLTERVALHRRLEEAVLGLHEPYKTALFLRYFEDLPPRRIAERLGVPVTTVHSRLQRGLALLRERLDDEYGQDRSAWVALFAPPGARGVPGAAPAATATGPALMGGILVNTKLLVAATLAVALGATLFVVRQGAAASGATGPERPATLAADEPPVLDALVADTAGEGLGVPARQALPLAESAPEAAPPAETAGGSIRLSARVLDSEGEPLAGVPVRTGDESGAVVGVSGPGGWLDFESDEPSGSLVVSDPPWVTVLDGSWKPGASYDPVVVVAPAIDFDGRVVDELGRALGGATVRLRLPDGFRTRFADVLDATRNRGWTTIADAQGRYRFESVPAVRGSIARGLLDGYLPDERQAPLVSRDDVDFELARPAGSLAGELRGRVVDPEGEAVPEARVGLGLSSVLTDEGGEFVFDLARAVTSESLMAVKAGHLPARATRPAEPREGATGWPDFVVLELGGPALAIGGRVVDHEGKPVSGAQVWLADPTPGGTVGMMPGKLEYLMAGARIPPEALESEAFLPETDGDNYNDFTSNAGPPSALWFWVATDAEGRFELPGLDTRHYRLNVLGEDSLEIVTSDPIRAGESGVLVKLPPPNVFDVVAGRVADTRGIPLPGVSVTLQLPVVDERARVFGGNVRVTLLRGGASVQTDEEGRFRFEDVPRDGVQLTYDSDDIVPGTLALGGDVLPRSVEILVAARCHVQVFLEDPGAADELAVADGEGRRLDVMVFGEGSMNAYTSVPLVGGRSGVVSVTSEARQLLFLSGGEVVKTLDIDLLPGEINRFDL